jgi:Uma2 family endonuclease
METQVIKHSRFYNQLMQLPTLKLLMDETAKKLKAENKLRNKFYNNLTPSIKAEFINGEIIMHSPVKLRHSQASDNLYRLLSTYVIKNKLGSVHHEKLLIKLTRNDYEPDICFFNKEKSGKFNADQMFFPAPDFVVEVLSPSTEKIDRVTKYEDYAAHGVEEYWIIDPEKQLVEQYLLTETGYELNMKSKTGMLKSKAVNYFEIPVHAIFDEKTNLKILNELFV